MTRLEIIELLEVIRSNYAAIKLQDPKGIVDLWEMEFAELPAHTVYQAARFHMMSSKYFPSVAEIRKIIYSKTYLAMETAAAIEQKAIEGEKVIKWEDCGCQLCPFLKDGQTEPCKFCVF